MEEKELTIGREIQLVAFKVGTEDFGVDVRKVEGVISLVDITRMPRAPEFVEGIINLRGQVIAVIDLATRLQIPASQRGSETRIVVVESQEVKVGLVVDSPEVINIEEDSVEPSPALATGGVESSLIRGVAKIDERLLILLDLDGVLSEEEREGIQTVETELVEQEEE